MKPVKALLLFVYCIAAITAIGTSISHLWRNNKSLAQEKAQSARLASS